jgi:hypothetical protein
MSHKYEWKRRDDPTSHQQPQASTDSENENDTLTFKKKSINFDN